MQSPLGQYGFNHIIMVACFVVKRMQQLPYDEIVDYLVESSTLLKTLFPKRILSRYVVLIQIEYKNV